MAVYEHGVDTDAVLEQYPQHRSARIAEDSQGVNLPLLRKWIRQQAGKVNDALAQHGYTDPENQLTDDSKETTADIIIQHAIGKALLYSGDKDGAQPYFDMAKDGMRQLHNMPERLGSSQPSGAQVHSNIDVNRRIKKRYGRDFKGW